MFHSFTLVRNTKYAYKYDGNTLDLTNNVGTKLELEFKYRITLNIIRILAQSKYLRKLGEVHQRQRHNGDKESVSEVRISGFS